MPLTGKEIVIAGRLTGQTQDELAAELRSRGAYVNKTLRASTSMLIVGARPGKRVEEAEALGVQLLHEADLPKFLNLPTQAYHSTAAVEERLAELRGLLNRAPGKETWFLICLLFDMWPDDELEVGITYASQHLQSWDSELLTSPQNWLEGAREESPNPRMALVRHLQATTKILEFPPHNESGTTQMLDPMLGSRGLITLLESGYIEEVEYISLPAQDIGDVGIKVLSAHEGLGQLRALHLEGNVYSAESVTALCDAAFLPQLESLSLQSHYLNRKELAELRQHPDLGHIKHLKLTPALRGTSWYGYDSDDESFEYYFCDDGHVRYSEDDTIYDEQKDQWRQLGDQFVISMTHGYAIYRGRFLSDGEIKGSSSNIADHHWTWDWKYLPDGASFEQDEE